MAATQTSRKDAVASSTVIASKGSHVVAVVVVDKDSGESEVRGYLRNLGDTRNGWAEQTEARRFEPSVAEKIAKLWNDSSEKAKKPERYEARPFESLFGNDAEAA